VSFSDELGGKKRGEKGGGKKGGRGQGSGGGTDDELQLDVKENEDLDVCIEEPLGDEENAAYAERQNKCNVSVVPPRAQAFQAPLIQLPAPRTQMLDARGCPCPEEEEEEEGVNFSFHPRADHATEVTFTVEPRKKPMWQTMMRCGFVPIINCSVPPCCLPDKAQHNYNYQHHNHPSSTSS
jgi:hypothetical protein